MQTQMLHEAWHLEYLEPGVDTGEFSPSLRPVTHLPSWSPNVSLLAGGFIAWLTRTITLAPTHMCVRYLLRVELVRPAAPGELRVFVNDHRVALMDAPGAYNADITDVVHLGANRLGLRVAGGARVEALYLTQRQCDIH